LCVCMCVCVVVRVRTWLAGWPVVQISIRSQKSSLTQTFDSVYKHDEQLVYQ
jgi:hypothetical protein